MADTHLLPTAGTEDDGPNRAPTASEATRPTMMGADNPEDPPPSSRHSGLQRTRGAGVEYPSTPFLPRQFLPVHRVHRHRGQRQYRRHVGDRREVVRRARRRQGPPPRPEGQGAGHPGGLDAQSSEIVAYMDVDLSTDLDGLLPLVAPLLSGHSQLAIGSRIAKGSRVLRGPSGSSSRGPTT